MRSDSPHFPTFKPSCYILRNEKYYVFKTYKGYHAAVVDLEIEFIVLDVASHPIAIGSATRLCLSQSRTQSIAEIVASNLAVSAKLYEARISELTVGLGYASANEFYYSAMMCGVALGEREITIKPMVHEKINAWGRQKADAIADILVPSTASDEELGAELLRGFMNCKSRKPGGFGRHPKPKTL
jgi:hypothetical protein